LLIFHSAAVKLATKTRPIRSDFGPILTRGGETAIYFLLYKISMFCELSINESFCHH